MPKCPSLLPCNLYAILALPATIFAQVAIAPAGSGTGVDPYQIASLENLYWLSQTPDAWNDTIVQTADIDASASAGWDGGSGFTPLGWDRRPFNGYYFGGGHWIKGVTIDRRTRWDVGFFGRVGGNAMIDSVNLIDVSIRGADACGGLVGGNWGGSIRFSSSTGSVTGDRYVGGLVGDNMGTIEFSFSRAAVRGSMFSGGLAGISDNQIVSSFSTGSVDGNDAVGGLLGYQREGLTRGCYASGRVTGSNRVGGLIGVNNRSNVDSCFWDIESSGWTRASGIDSFTTTRATGLTTDQARTRSSYPGWNFSEIWEIQEGRSYPRLSGFFMPQDFLGDPLPIFAVGQPDFDPGMTATPGLPVRYGVADTLIAKVVSGKIRLVGPGETTITAHQDGDEEYRVSQSWPEPLIVLPYATLPGSGAETDPYRIASLDDLLWLSLNPESWGSSFIQTEDLDLSATRQWNGGFGFIPLGTARGHFPRGFRGKYNGKGHAIAGLDINRVGMGASGFFATVIGGAIDSLTIQDGHLVCSRGCGLLAGSIQGTTVRGCHATGAVSGERAVGGLIGSMYEGSMEGSHAAVAVDATDAMIGGLVGIFENGSISRSFASGPVHGTSMVGGLVGMIRVGTIRSSYALGEASGASQIGGLLGVGWHVQASNTYSAGRVSGTFPLGGLIGSLVGGQIDSSYWDRQKAALDTGCGGKDSTGVFHALGLSTAKMQTQASFVGWDFTDVWSIKEGQGYPSLWSMPESQPQIPTAGRAHPHDLDRVADWYPLSIHGIDGSQAWSGRAFWTGSHWELPFLGTGTWILRIRTPQGLSTERFVVMKK